MGVQTLPTMASLLVLLCSAFAQVAAGEPNREIASLIRQAGNAEDDTVRLELLRKLQARPGVDAKLKADVDHMIAAVERWLDQRNLTYFGGEVSRTLDFYPHGRPSVCAFRDSRILDLA